MSHSISALYESHSNASSARLLEQPAQGVRAGNQLFGFVPIVRRGGGADDEPDPMACGGAMLSFPMPETGGERLIDILKDHGSLDVEGPGSAAIVAAAIGRQ
jgi:hypothetical protein